MRRRCTKLAATQLSERMAADERSLLVLIRGLGELEEKFRRFEAGLATGERSYYRPEDDDEIRRMLVKYLSFRTALLRTVWYYQATRRIAGRAGWVARAAAALHRGRGGV